MSTPRNGRITAAASISREQGPSTSRRIEPPRRAECQEEIHLHRIGVEYHRLGLPRNLKHQSAERIVDRHDTSWLSAGVTLQNRLKRLHGRHGRPIRGHIVVSQRPHLLQTPVAFAGRSAELDIRNFLEEAPEYFHAVAALTPLAPRFHKRRVIVVIGVYFISPGVRSSIVTSTPRLRWWAF